MATTWSKWHEGHLRSKPRQVGASGAQCVADAGVPRWVPVGWTKSHGRMAWDEDPTWALYIYISLYHFIAHFIYIYIYIFISLMFKLGKTSMNGSWRFPVAMLDCWKLRCERCEIQVCDEVWHFTTTVAPTCFHQFSPMVCQSSNVFMYVCVCLSACMHVKDSICTYIYIHMYRILSVYYRVVSVYVYRRFYRWE